MTIDESSRGNRYFKKIFVCLHEHVCTMCVQEPEEVRRGIRSFGAEVTDVCEQ